MQNMTIYTVHFQKYGWNPEESSMLPARKSLNSNPFGGGTPNHPKLDNFSIETHGFGGFPILGNLMKPQFVRDTLW